MNHHAPRVALAQVEDQAQHQAQHLLSPTVGRFRPGLAEGAWVRAGDTVGWLEVLGDRSPLIVPPLQGVWSLHLALPRAWTPVGYGTILATLHPAHALPDAGGAHAMVAKIAGLPEGALPVPAPIDGMFYRSRTPAEPPLIEEGALVRQGQVIGLIEVMKFFYEIKLDLPALGPQARVVRVEARSAAPVDAGAPLFYAVPEP